jgi:hypothetical protein
VEKNRLRCLLVSVLLWLGGVGALEAARQESAGEAVLERYLAATQEQQAKVADWAMEVDIKASLPRLNKTGTLHAWRYVTRLGAITYRALTIQGDTTVKKDVIARYLQAEKEAGEKTGMTINRENYKFSYRGEYPWGRGKLHLFYLEPRRKQVGLFRGWLWVDGESALPVREEGVLSKSPSVFLKRIEFVRDYTHRDGVAIPISIDSRIQTRIIGTAEVHVRYSNITRQTSTAAVATTANRR